MSVLIKGMEMPENCMECAIKTWTEDEGDVCPFSGIMALNIGRQNDCPLVEVPKPHGILIDAEKFKKALDERFDEMRNKHSGIRFGPGWMLAGSVIVHSPTVIEAEGEEHDE